MSHLNISVTSWHQSFGKIGSAVWWFWKNTLIIFSVLLVQCVFSLQCKSLNLIFTCIIVILAPSLWLLMTYSTTLTTPCECGTFYDLIVFSNMEVKELCSCQPWQRYLYQCYVMSLSLRAKYGSSDLKNALHGSESFHAAEREIKFMFPNCK